MNNSGMGNLNNIVLDDSKTDELGSLLNTLLSDYSVFYQNVRWFHRNMEADEFFEIQENFEKLYKDVLVRIDELTEGILILGQTPEYKRTDDLKYSVTPEVKEVTSGYGSIEQILKSFKILLARQGQILASSTNLHDEGTNTLMSNCIGEQEKLIWMYRSFLCKN